MTKIRKNSKALLLAAGTALALFSGCSKPVQPEVKNSKPKTLPPLSKISLSSLGLTYYNYGTTITENDFLDNPADAADQSFNYVNHAMTLALLEIYHNYPTLLNDLIIDVDRTPHKSRDLFDFADNHPQVNAIFDAVFSARFNDFSNYGTWKAYVEAKYTYDIDYVPYVAFLNPDNFDLNEPAFISEPLEIDEEKFTQFDDDYPLWIFDGSKDYFSTVNDKTVGNIPNPIMAVRNAKRGMEMEDYRSITDPYNRVGVIGEPIYIPPVQPMSCDLNPLPSTHTHENIDLMTWRVDLRYENKGKSEVRFYYVKTATYKPLTGIWDLYANSNGDAVIRQQGQDIEHYDVGNTTFTCGATLFGPYEYTEGNCFDIPNMTAAEYRFFCLGAFEWDWGTEPKELGQFWLPSAHALRPLKGRMKYESEWYFFDKDNNTGYNFHGRHPNPNSTITIWNKGFVTMRRN